MTYYLTNSIFFSDIKPANYTLVMLYKPNKLDAYADVWPIGKFGLITGKNMFTYGAIDQPGYD